MDSRRVKAFISRRRGLFFLLFGSYFFQSLLWAIEIYVTFLFVAPSQASFVKCFLIVTLGSFFTVIPVPGAMGVYELTYVSLFALLRIEMSAGMAVILTMVVSAAGAYSLTRYQYLGREKIAGLILCTYMFAHIMVVIPFFILAKKVGIENTHFALVLAFTSFCLPFTLWLMRAFFKTIPLQLEEAALIDGAGRVRAVIYVILPLALPGIIATSIFTFILAWNDYIFTRILITSDELKTLPVGVQDLFHSALIDWGLIMAAGMMITIPALLFFVAVQRYLIRGWGAGAVKG